MVSSKSTAPADGDNKVVVPAVMRAIGIEHWQKTEVAKREIAERGFAED